MAEIRTRQVRAKGLVFTIDEAGDGDDVVLFLHGFPESRRSWRRQLGFIGDLGWRAVAPDLRGYGQSDRPRERAAYRLEPLIADVAALFDALGARRRIVVGHDWGGIIAWTAAIERVTPLDGLVVMNAPHPAAYARLARRSWRQMARSWYVLFFQLPWAPEAFITAGHARAVGRAFENTASDSSVFSPEDLRHYRDNAVRPGAMTAMIDYYRANALALSRADRTLARRIDAPTLLVWGDQDPFLGVELTQALDAYVADLTLRRLADVAHWVQQEAADRVNDAMRCWMVDKQLI